MHLSSISNHIKFTYSFDVYDTCLTRIFAQPTDLFFEWERRVLKHGRIKEKVASKISLAACRIQAEKKARGKKVREDICFADIYRFILPMGLSSEDIAVLMELEMALEEECLAPVAEIKQKICDIRKKSQASILFISNMYLPGDFIQKQLLRHGIAKPEDPVYVSGDIGLSKHTGSLFKYVLKKHNLKPEQLVHTGDNPRSDIKAAQRLGIHTVYYTGARLTNRECIIASQKQPDKITNSMIAGASRLCRTRLCPKPDFNGFGIDVITSVAAPMLTAFTTWVLKSAYRDGVKRLYFLSRDAQLFYKIAQILSKKMAAPECRYLYSSRLAWIGAAINKTKVETEGIKAICIGNTAKSPGQIFERLGIQQHEFTSNHLSSIGISFDNLDTKLTPSEAESFGIRLSNHPFFKQLIINRAADRRKTTLGYFEQEGLLNKDCRWAIVDIGWRLSSQKALYDLLKIAGYPRPPIGYYFGLSIDRYPERVTGHIKAFTSNFSENSQMTTDWTRSQSSVALLENIFLRATHPPLNKYTKCNEKIIPEYSRLNIHSKQKKFTDILHKVVLNFAEFFSINEALSNNVEKIRESTLLSWKKFINSPLQEEVCELQWLPVNIEFSHDPNHTRRLACPLTARILSQIVCHHFWHSQPYENSNLIWLEGSAALSSPPIRSSFFLMQKIRRTLTKKKGNID